MVPIKTWRTISESDFKSAKSWMSIVAGKYPREYATIRVRLSLPKKRIYALRARLMEGRPSGEVAQTFRNSAGSFQVLRHYFPLR